MRLFALFAFVIASLLSLPVTAQTPSPAATSGVALLSNQSQATAAVPAGDFLSAVLQAVQQFGGLSWALKISTICLLLIASMKVTALDDLVWGKLGALQAWAAPILGLITGIAMLASQGKITLAGLVAYLGAGAGAVLLHELLDSFKAIPGLGSSWVGIIATIENVFGGNPTPNPAPGAPATVNTVVAAKT